MRVGEWDDRYAASELVWGAEPNRWLAAEAASLVPGRALDLACGEGRNAHWLAARGWQVTASDFSQVALDKAAAVGGAVVEWVLADATERAWPSVYDLVVVCYLQLAAAERRSALAHAARAVAEDGLLLVIAHDSSNLTDGTGGPQDASVLYAADDVVDDVGTTEVRFEVEDAGVRLRDVEGASRPARDTVVRLRRRDLS